ncbi:GrpE protein [Dehalogenimonas lykanthroporepellens BL-DC-9]|jgi:molecular chaperone GrpE|nr:GrpE protein [Dehalogenimonas lykanthroporepellens BL-DC-9]
MTGKRGNQESGERELQEEFERLSRSLEQEKGRAEENLNSFKRAQADFINYKRRAEAEKADSVAFGKSLAFLSILPVLDDFSRALEAVPPDLADNSWVNGISLIEKKFRQLLEKEGVTPMKTVGQAFDPAYHEAVLRCPGEEGVIVEELLTGYMYKDKVLRQAQVKVACEDISE